MLEYKSRLIIEKLFLLKQENNELNKVNRELIRQSNAAKELNRKLAAILEREQKEKASRKESHGNKQWLTKYKPMTCNIYSQLIKYTLVSRFQKYKYIRLRVALCILFLTGIKLNQLLKLKVYHLQTLLDDHWISIDGYKRGLSHDKACLTEKGKEVIRARKTDLEIIFYNKAQNSYIFTSESRPNRMLRHETITRDINQTIKSISDQLPNNIFISSHSFRIGDITQLWEDPEDIKFVKQTIRHQVLNTTSRDVNKLINQEKLKRSSKL